MSAQLLFDPPLSISGTSFQEKGRGSLYYFKKQFEVKKKQKENIERYAKPIYSPEFVLEDGLLRSFLERAYFIQRELESSNEKEFTNLSTLVILNFIKMMSKIDLQFQKKLEIDRIFPSSYGTLVAEWQFGKLLLSLEVGENELSYFVMMGSKVIEEIDSSKLTIDLYDMINQSLENIYSDK